MRYNRSDIMQSLKAGVYESNKSNKVIYVYATAYGYIVTKIKPPLNQEFYKIQNNNISNKEGKSVTFTE